MTLMLMLGASVYALFELSLAQALVSGLSFLVSVAFLLHYLYGVREKLRVHSKSSLFSLYMNSGMAPSIGKKIIAGACTIHCLQLLIWSPFLNLDIQSNDARFDFSLVMLGGISFALFTFLFVSRRRSPQQNLEVERD